MSESSAAPRSVIHFEDPSDLEGEVEKKLKRRMGGGLFIDKHVVSDNGDITIRLGNVVPMDVSDCRQHDRVINFLTYNRIYEMKAEPTNGNYVLKLPDRSEIYEGFLARKQQVARRLDRSIAKAIYEELVSFTPVRNQLNGVKNILWVVREKQPVAERDIIAMQGKESEEQTRLYLQILKETKFIQQSDGMYYPDSNLNAHDEVDVESDEFSKLVLGQIVEQAFHTLRDEANLTMLSHYPKYAGSYYFSALRRNKYDLKLNVEAIRDNLSVIYGDEEHKFRVEKKLNDLADVDIIHRDDGMFYGNSDVFEQVAGEAPV